LTLCGSPQRFRAWPAAITSGIIVLASFLLSFSVSTQATGFLASDGGLIERICGIAAMTWL
jgi:hypothetical protein